MEHLKAIGIKAIYVSIIILSLFGAFHSSTIMPLLFLSLLLTFILYMFGDVLIYPRFGMVWASLADFGLAFFSTMFFGGVLLQGNFPMILPALASAFFIFCIEPLFHAYMAEKVLQMEQRDDEFFSIRTVKPQYMTEFSDELSEKSTDKQTSKKEHHDQ